MKAILSKLQTIQETIVAKKDLHNNFGNYNYRSCEKILESLKPFLRDMKCIITLSDEIINLGDRFYVKATAYIIDIETGERCSTDAYARESFDKKGMDAAQITGAASSYARKYALSGRLALDDGKDADSMDNDNNTQKDKKSATATQYALTEDEYIILTGFIADKGSNVDIKTLEGIQNATDNKTWTKALYDNTIKYLSNLENGIPF